MELRWIAPERPDAHDVAAATAVLEGAREVDAPFRFGYTTQTFLADVQHGWDEHPPRYAVVLDDGGAVVGVVSFEIGFWDNHHLAVAEVTIDPVHRRRGLGTAALDEVIQVARKDGRTTLIVPALETSAGEPILRAAGFEEASREAQRRLHLTSLDRAEVARHLAAATRAAEGYELVRVPGAVPDEMLPAVADLTAAINDAPIDDLDIEDEVFTPERLRCFERAQTASARRVYRLLARERSTGALAGVSVLGVEAERPWHAWQFDTSVPRAHRGHRLGLLLKTGMLEWLAEAEPQLRTIDTWNAESNDHMVAINVLLGFELLTHDVDWQLRL